VVARGRPSGNAGDEAVPHSCHRFQRSRELGVEHAFLAQDAEDLGVGRRLVEPGARDGVVPDAQGGLDRQLEEALGAAELRGSAW